MTEAERNQLLARNAAALAAAAIQQSGGASDLVRSAEADHDRIADAAKALSQQPNTAVETSAEDRQAAVDGYGSTTTKFTAKKLGEMNPGRADAVQAYAESSGAEKAAGFQQLVDPNSSLKLMDAGPGTGKSFMMAQAYGFHLDKGGLLTSGGQPPVIVTANEQTKVDDLQKDFDGIHADAKHAFKAGMVEQEMGPEARAYLESTLRQDKIDGKIAKARAAGKDTTDLQADMGKEAARLAELERANPAFKDTVRARYDQLGQQHDAELDKSKPQAMTVDKLAKDLAVNPDGYKGAMINLDEAGMASHGQMAAIMEHVRQNGGAFIAVGDQHQMGPENQTMESAFSMALKASREAGNEPITLNHTMRQSKLGHLDAATSLRKHIDAAAQAPDPAAGERILQDGVVDALQKIAEQDATDSKLTAGQRLARDGDINGFGANVADPSLRTANDAEATLQQAVDMVKLGQDGKPLEGQMLIAIDGQDAEKMTRMLGERGIDPASVQVRNAQDMDPSDMVKTVRQSQGASVPTAIPAFTKPADSAELLVALTRHTGEVKAVFNEQAYGNTPEKIAQQIRLPDGPQRQTGQTRQTGAAEQTQGATNTPQSTRQHPAQTQDTVAAVALQARRQAGR